VLAGPSNEKIRTDGRVPSSNSKLPGVLKSSSEAEAAAACSQKQSSGRTGSSRYRPLVSATTFGPRTFGNQISRPPFASDSKWKPTSRYERGPQPKKNGLTTSCAAIAVLPRSDQDKATADPSCGKNICCSSNSPSARRNRETGQ